MRANPRQLLERHYALDGEIPNNITRKIVQKEKYEMNDSSSISTFEDIEARAIMQVYKDKRISAKEREQISTSILQGKYKIIERDNDIPKVRIDTAKGAERKRDQFLVLNRHKLKKPHFLELNTTKVEVPPVSPKEVYRKKPVSQLPPNPLSPTFRVSLKNEELLPQEQIRISSSSINFSQSIPNDVKARLMAEDRSKKLQRDKEEARMMRQAVQEMKRLEKESIEKKVEVQKRFQEFRREIHDYLRDRKDPMTGQIMRCVDDSMIFHFMEKFNGYNMTVEGVLTLIGNALGSSMIQPDPEILQSSSDNSTFDEEYEFNRNQSQHLAVSNILNNLRPTRSVGNSHLSPFFFRPRSADLPKKSNYILTKLKEYEANPGEEHSFLRSHESTTDAIVKDMKPRYFELHPRPLTSEKTLGGGFRASSSRVSDSEFEDFNDSFLDVNTLSTVGRNSFSKSVSENQFQNLPQGGASLGSDHLIKSATQMGFNPKRGKKGNIFKSDMSQTTESSNVVVTSEAISAIHDQMVEERSLPSIQPQKIMTEEQIEKFGKKEKSFEDLMEEMSQASQDSDKGKNDKKKSMFNLLSQGIGEVSISKDMGVKRQEFSDEFKNADEETRAKMLTENMPSLPLFGSVLNAHSREKLKDLSNLEKEKAKHRYGLVKTPKQMLQLGQRSLYSNSRRFQKTAGNSGITPAPIALKTRGEAPNLHSSRPNSDPSIQHNSLPAVSPFKTWAEETKVMNTGIPAGAGLMLWRPRDKVTRQGRYRAGHLGKRMKKVNPIDPTGQNKPYVTAA